MNIITGFIEEKDVDTENNIPFICRPTFLLSQVDATSK